MNQLASAIATSTARQPGREPVAHRPLAVIHLRGSQAEMGEQHGSITRQLGGYRELVEFYTELPERIILHADSTTRPDWIVRKAGRIIKELLLGRLERRRPPAYLARSRAFMEALGLPAGHARYLTVMDLLQNVVGTVGRLGVGPFSRLAAEAAVPACSSLMAWGDASADGQLRHARNFDFPGVGIWDRGPSVVFCTPDRGLRYGFASSRGADTPGVSAFNEAGLTVTMHTRFHRHVTFDGAAIVDIGHDIARRAETIDDAVALVRELQPIASTWGMAVSSAAERRAVVIETTARTVAVVEPGAGDSYLTCANRYRHPSTQAGQVSASAAWEAHSSGRQRRLCELAERARQTGGLTAEQMQRALADRVDPQAPETSRGSGAVLSQPCTVKSIVVEPERRAIHISTAPAPTGRGPYAEVAWDWDAPVGGRESDGVTVPAPGDDAERAFLRYTEATRLDRQANDWRGALGCLEQAIALAPADPSYRFPAGVLRLRAGDFARALEHLTVGLAHETIPLRRGQLLLWASRAADAAGEPVRASRLRREIRCMDHDQLAEHRGLAAAEERRRWDPGRRSVQLNMLISDAW